MSETPEEYPEFSWKAHPARERRGSAVVAGATILAMGTATTLFMASVWWGVFAVVILLLALNRFFLPSRFSIDADGITARYPLTRRRFRWADLRRIASDGRSAYLGTRARRSRLDAYRGLHVLFGDQGEAVMTRLRDHLSPDVSPDVSPHALSAQGGEATWAR